MIDNDFISVHRETLAFALGLKCHGHKNKTEQAADRRHAERQIRAALADPMPPAGGEVEAMSNKTITPTQVNQPKGSGSLEFDGLLAAFHAIVWATAEDDDPDLAYDEAGNVEAKKLQAMYRALQSELTKARELLKAIPRGVPGFGDWTDKVSEYLSNQSAPADKKECTSCDGSGEFVDAIGDWRGYCSCPAGVELKNRPAPADKGHGEPHAHEWDINDQGTATVCSVCGVRSSDEQPAPVAAPKMCDCNQGRLPCTCKEPAPVEFDKGAALESLAKQIYESWQAQPGYNPWVNGGNSLKQDEARRIASRTFELALASQVED